MPREVVRVLALARAGIEDPRAGRKLAGKGLNGSLDFGFEVQDVAPQRLGKAFREARVFHLRRASIITVEPAPQAASTSVKGKAATTIAR